MIHEESLLEAAQVKLTCIWKHNESRIKLEA
jgi:hypothetical protein